MGRLGVAPQQAVALAVVAQRQGVRVVGLMTHFANADADNPSDADSSTLQQLATFAAAKQQLLAAGIPLQVCHAANSSGAMMFSDRTHGSRSHGVGVVRERPVGHGCATAPARRQAMRLVTEVAQVRSVAADFLRWYGGLWRAMRDSKVAVLPIGSRRRLARKRAIGAFSAIIAGVRCPLVGAISMDIAIADVSDVPQVNVGDSTVLLGRDASGDQISTNQYAQWTGTHRV